MTTNTIPEQYKTDNLFLIIGANPLPNYVAARLLLKEHGKLYMINTGGDTGTKDVANQLRVHLRDEYDICTTDRIIVSDSDAFNIYDQVTNKIDTISEHESIGLHYTGGTKAMAVHAYRALQDAKHLSIFSYLDAREMCLIFDSIDGERVQSHPLKEWPLSGEKSRPPTIRDLTDLHQETLREGVPEQVVVLPDVAQKLAHACKTYKVADVWRKWCNNKLKGNAYDWSNGRWRPEQSLRHTNIEWPDNHILRQALAGGFGLANEPFFNLGQATDTRFQRCEDLCLWLDGFWIEYYVLSCIESIKDEAQIHDYGMGLRTNLGDGAAPIYNKENLKTKHDFEMDVAAMRSYQLFAISCTTSTSKAKTKLFEAMIRSQQLGGDEARTGLVAPVRPAQAQKLEKEVAEKWQMGKKVKVFSPTTWPNLAAELKQWFERGE